jgi:perosamine synthetase
MKAQKRHTIPWWRPQIGKKEYGLIKKVLDNDYPNQGAVTREFEGKVAALTGAGYAIAVPNATSAMCLALKALGIGPGDEVIVQDNTYIATANAVTLTGAKPVLVDANPDTLMIDLAATEKATTSKTKAMVPVHVSGRAAPMKEIMALAKARGLYVVEDAAEAFGTKSGGQHLGTFGDAGCFSFSPQKIITTGQGGMVVTNSKAIEKRVRELKNQGVYHQLTGGNDTHYSLGFNFKFTDLQAAVGVAQLSYMPARLRRMARTHELYKKRLAGVRGIKLFECKTRAGEIPLWNDVTAERRDELVEYLKGKNIDCRKFWYPLHTQAPYRRDGALFPNASAVAPRCLWLPSAFTLTDRDVETVCREIKTFFDTTRSFS